MFEIKQKGPLPKWHSLLDKMIAKAEHDALVFLFCLIRVYAHVYCFFSSCPAPFVCHVYAFDGQLT